LVYSIPYVKGVLIRLFLDELSVRFVSYPLFSFAFGPQTEVPCINVVVETLLPYGEASELS
jgi:hypothetical protein